MYNNSTLDNQLSSNMYVGAYLWRREFIQCHACAFYTRAFHTCVVYMPIPLLAQSIWCTLHAVFITCAIHAQKMTITRSFITRGLSQPFFTEFDNFAGQLRHSGW